MKFSTKLIVSIGSLTLIIAGVTSVVIYAMSRRILVAELEDRLHDASMHASSTLDRILFERVADIEVMASEPAVTAPVLSVRDATVRMLTFRNAYKSYLTISVFDGGERVADASALDLGGQPPDDDFWRRLAESSGPIVDRESASAFGKRVIRFGAPVTTRPERFVVAYTSLDLLGQLLAGAVESTDDGTGFFLVDRTGNLLFRAGAGVSWREITGQQLAGVVSGADDSVNGEASFEGEDYVYAYARSTGYLSLPAGDWVLFALKSKQAAFAPLYQLQLVVTMVWVAGIALMVAGVWIAGRRIVRPILGVTDAAGRIAQGDLDVSVDVKSRDEVGALADAFRQMNEALLDMAEMAEAIARGDLTATVEPRGEQDRLGRALSEMQRNLGEQIGQIVEATGTLAASGSQISAFSSQLAASAAESAAAVGETTATVEEVKQTAQLSSEKAKEVSEAAQDTVAVSRRGEQSVSESLEVMKQIQQQMQEIGESILKLSEKNQTIGEIIMSVAELSDQSNLLAVNAAIEASRAGEHGKGFTVVAQEIRSLAEQSKKATEQVRGLLSDIQKATNAAVLSMEQGSKAMEQGLSQSGESGEAIRELTEHIERAAEAATQIAASSRQQLAGMDQVAGAMEAIREATEQNVDSTKQMEHEVQSLTNLGGRLESLVHHYRTEEQVQKDI